MFLKIERVLLLSLCIFVTLQSSVCFAQEILWKTFFESGEAALTRGDLCEAEKQFESAVKDAESMPKKDPRLLRSLRKLAEVYDEQGKFAQSEPLLLRVIELDAKSSGKGQCELATDLNSLAMVYTHEGKYGEAEPLYKRALSIWQKAFGSEDPNVATVSSNLAMLHMNQGDYKEAERLLKSSISVYEKVKGDSDPLVARGLDNLAKLYVLEGKYSEAEALFKRALTIKVKSLGPVNVEVAATLTKLGQLYEQQGRSVEAEPLLKRALAITEQVTGLNSPQLAEQLVIMADLLEAEGKGAQAKDNYLRALRIREKTLPENHPKLAESLSRLAGSYFDDFDYSKAEELYRRALRIGVEGAVQADLNQAKDLNSLALLYVHQGQYEQAKPLYDKALATVREKLGPNHPDVAACLNNLAFLFQNQAKFEEAESLLKEGLAIRQKALGEEHPSVAQNLANLASIYKLEGRLPDAEAELKRSLAIAEKTLGADHQDVAQIQGDLAEVLCDQKKYFDAEILYRKLLERDEKMLGYENPAVAGDLENLVAVLTAQGKQAEAEPYRKRSVAIKTRLPGGRSVRADYVTEAQTIISDAKHRLPVKDKWALVVGISKYKDPAINLKYAAKDATDFRNYLVSEAHFKTDHVKLLTDENATRANIVASLGEGWLGRVTHPGDLIVVYVSTHGSAAKHEAGDTNFIVPYEANLENLVLTGIPMQWLTVGLKEMLHCDRLLVILDVCHSGAAAGGSGPALSESRAEAPVVSLSGQKGLQRMQGVGPVKLQAITQSGQGDEAKGLERSAGAASGKSSAGYGEIVLASSASDQVSWESKGYPNSVFTRRLIEGLRLNGDRTSLTDAYFFMRDQVEEEVLRDRAQVQTPVLMKQQWRGDDVVLGLVLENAAAGDQSSASGNATAGGTALPVGVDGSKIVAPKGRLELSK